MEKNIPQKLQFKPFIYAKIKKTLHIIGNEKGNAGQNRYFQVNFMKTLFEYLEYRDFLRDHFDMSKQRYPFFSYRYIAGKTGLDASFYVKVLQKQLHVSDKAIPRLVEFLQLTKKEAEYFGLLVRFNRVKHQDKTRHYFEKLIELREPLINTLDAEKYEFFNKWYYVAIRELLNHYHFCGNFKDLAAKLNPPITVVQARHAITLLEKLSLVKKDGNGVYQLTDQFITTGELWNSLAIENFQKEAITLAGESISRIAKKDRETSTITVSISRNCFDAMKNRLKEVRKELLEMARLDKKQDSVYHINFQMFPLTTKSKDGKKV